MTVTEVVIYRVMAQIKDILHRRTDLSTFLVHLTRSAGGKSAKQRLKAIYVDHVLLASSPMGWADDEDDPEDASAQSQRVVCFSEAPLEQVWTFVLDIEGRQNKFRPYGVAIPKYEGRKLGINPVWYVDMTPGRDWQIANALNEVKTMAQEAGDFHGQPEARLFPFIEPMGSWQTTTGTQREFWWEREWRHIGNLHLPQMSTLFLCPEAEMDEVVAELHDEGTASFRREKRRFIDPTWGLERIIAHLAGIPTSSITPFTAG